MASFASSQGEAMHEQTSVKVPQKITGRLLVMGDSLSAAYGIEVPQGWVSLLQQRLRTSSQTKLIEVINASISGETTSGGKQRFPKLLNDYQPRWVILELGANDALRGQNLQSTSRNLAAMIEACLNADFECQVMLLGIRLPTNYGPAYDRFLQKVYSDLAQKYQLVFDPFFLENVALDPGLMQQDGLHPNVQAQSHILQRLWPNIKALLLRTVPN